MPLTTPAFSPNSGFTGIEKVRCQGKTRAIETASIPRGSPVKSPKRGLGYGVGLENKHLLAGHFCPEFTKGFPWATP